MAILILLVHDGRSTIDAGAKCAYGDADALGPPAARTVIALVRVRGNFTAVYVFFRPAQDFPVFYIYVISANFVPTIRNFFHF